MLQRFNQLYAHSRFVDDLDAVLAENGSLGCLVFYEELTLQVCFTVFNSFSMHMFLCVGFLTSLLTSLGVAG